MDSTKKINIHSSTQIYKLGNLDDATGICYAIAKDN
jgi:hypothetical protein